MSTMHHEQPRGARRLAADSPESVRAGHERLEPHPRVSFVIPVRNDARGLERCLASIARNSGSASAEIVVVDNGSDDDTVEVARRQGAIVVDVPDARVSKLRNTGVARSRGDLIAFVDADHELGDGWLTAVLEGFDERAVGARGAPYLAPPNPTWVQAVYDLFRTHESGPVEAEWVGSGNLVVSREAFAAAGGFDETLEACEDVDFCARLREAGYRIINDPGLVSRHFGDPASLQALFVSELWRGRDNLRVTLRPPVSRRSIASLAIPLLTLAGLSMAILGLATGQPDVALPGLALVLAFIVLRAAILASRGTPSLSLLGQSLAVAAVYNLGRALALVWRAKHRRARGTNRVAAMGAVR